MNKLTKFAILNYMPIISILLVLFVSYIFYLVILNENPTLAQEYMIGISSAILLIGGIISMVILLFGVMAFVIFLFMNMLDWLEKQRNKLKD